MNHIYRTYNTGTACIVYCMRANTSEAALDMLQGWVGEYVVLALSPRSLMNDALIYMIFIPRDYDMIHLIRLSFFVSPGTSCTVCAPTMARRRWTRCRGSFENMFCWRTCIHIKYINTHDTYTRTHTQCSRVSCMHTHIHTQVGARTCSAGESVYTYNTFAHTIHKHTHTRSIRGYNTYTHTQSGGCENMFRWRKCITYYTYNTLHAHIIASHTQTHPQYSRI